MATSAERASVISGGLGGAGAGATVGAAGGPVGAAIGGGAGLLLGGLGGYFAAQADKDANQLSARQQGLNADLTEQQISQLKAENREILDQKRRNRSLSKLIGKGFAGANRPSFRRMGRG